MIIQDTMQSQIKILFYHLYIFFLKKGAISLSLWKSLTNKRLGNRADFEMITAISAADIGSSCMSTFHVH